MWSVVYLAPCVSKTCDSVNNLSPIHENWTINDIFKNSEDSVWICEAFYLQNFCLNRLYHFIRNAYSVFLMHIFMPSLNFVIYFPIVTALIEFLPKKHPKSSDGLVFLAFKNYILQIAFIFQGIFQLNWSFKGTHVQRNWDSFGAESTCKNRKSVYMNIGPELLYEWGTAVLYLVSQRHNMWCKCTIWCQSRLTFTF